MARKLHALMLFSLAYGGFLLLVFIAQLYFLFWRREFLPLFPSRRLAAGGAALNPTAEILSPFSLGLLFTGVAFLANGYCLWQFTSQSHRREAREEVYKYVLTPDEQNAFEKLREAGGELTQKELSIKAGFSPVMAHRIVTRLKNKGAVEVHPFGMTNKIVVK